MFLSVSVWYLLCLFPLHDTVRILRCWVTFSFGFLSLTFVSSKLPKTLKFSRSWKLFLPWAQNHFTSVGVLRLENKSIRTIITLVTLHHTDRERFINNLHVQLGLPIHLISLILCILSELKYLQHMVFCFPINFPFTVSLKLIALPNFYQLFWKYLLFLTYLLSPFFSLPLVNGNKSNSLDMITNPLG